MAWYQQVLKRFYKVIINTKLGITGSIAAGCPQVFIMILRADIYLTCYYLYLTFICHEYALQHIFSNLLVVTYYPSQLIEISAFPNNSIIPLRWINSWLMVPPRRHAARSYPGTHYTKDVWSHYWNIAKIVFVLILFSRSSQVTILHISQQLGCCDMCKIMAWSAHSFIQVRATLIFARYGLWAHKLYCENGSVLASRWVMDME